MPTKTPSDLPDRLLSCADLARFIGVSPMTLWRYRRAADFPAPVLVNKRPRFRLDEIRAWLERRRATGGEAPAAAGMPASQLAETQ